MNLQKSLAVAIVLGLIAHCDISAQAASLNLAVDSSQSSLSESIGLTATVLGFPFTVASPAVSQTLSGAAPGNVSPPAHTGWLGSVALAGNVPGTLTDQGGGFGFTNLNVTLNGPSIPLLGGGSVSVGLMAPHISIGLDGPFSPLSSGAGTATYDVSGLPLQLDAGLFNYSSTGYLNFIGSGSVPLLSNIVNISLPSGSHGTLNLSGNHVTLSIPLNVSIPLLSVGNSTLGASLDAILSGTAVFTGVIPEPSSLVLLGVGLGMLLPLARRRVVKRA
jgi:hypothetical protein